MAFENATSSAVQDFSEFAYGWDTSGHPEDYTHLQDYLQSWLYEGHAVEKTAGSFEMYLRVALHIADAVLKDPSMLDYSGEAKIANLEAYSRNPTTGNYERPIAGVVDPDSHSYSAFDRYEYEDVRFDLENRGRGFLSRETHSTRLPLAKRLAAQTEE